MKERQELHCHNCDKYVQFDMDVSLNGKHVINCPFCGHEHLRYVNKGVISDRRWGSRNVPTIQTWATTATDTSVYDLMNATATDTASYFASSWLNATLICGG
jgi:hypothetical protein